MAGYLVRDVVRMDRANRNSLVKFSLLVLRWCWTSGLGAGVRVGVGVALVLRSCQPPASGVAGGGFLAFT